MLTDTNFVDELQGLGGIGCEPATLELCWPAMDNAAGAGSSSSGGGGNPVAVRKRRKSEPKPLAQLTRSMNEKRRRQQVSVPTNLFQENIYIEELAELVSENLSELSSTSLRSDKCAILQETVNLIRQIKKEQDEEQHNDEPDEGVQQGQVSSTRALPLDNKMLANYLLDALDGFLFVLSVDGRLEYVSENVTAYLRRSAEELKGQPLMSLVYSEDQSDFGAAILQTNAGSRDGSSAQSRNRSLTCRLVVQSSEESGGTQYETMQIAVVAQPCVDENGLQQEKTEAHSLVGVARRFVPFSRDSVLQFVTKLDLSGKILAVDMTGCSSLNYKRMKGRIFQDLCHPQDVSVFSFHFKEAVQSGSSTSTTYRLRLDSSEYVTVQTKFKRFPYSPPKSDFVMATHTVLPEKESTSTGNPVLASLGEQDAGAALTSVSNSTELASFSLPSTDLALSDFNLDLFPSSTWGAVPADEEPPKPHPVPHNPASCSVEPPSCGVKHEPQTSLDTSNVELSFVDDLPGFSPLKDQTPDTPLYEDPFKSEAKQPSPGTSESRLRGLLMQNSSSSSTASQDGDFMFKILLEPPVPSPKTASSSQGSNDTLLSLLNQKNEDQSVMKRDEQLLKSLGFPLPSKNLTSPTKKRQAEEPTSVQPRLLELAPAEGSDPFIGSSELCKKNKMLASLLAKEPMQPTVPVNPISLNPSGLPQEKLPKDLKQKMLQAPARNWAGGSMRSSPSLAQQQQFCTQQKQDSKSYLNSMSTAPSQRKSCSRIMERGSLQQSLESRTYCTSVRFERTSQPFLGEDAPGPDHLLSDILDQIIEMDPSYDANAAVTVPIDDDLNALFEQLTSPSPVGSAPPPLVPIPQPHFSSTAAPYNDTATIDAIERSLMAFETPAAAPSPPGFSIGYHPVQHFAPGGIAVDASSQPFGSLPSTESLPFGPWTVPQQPKRPNGMSWHTLSDPSAQGPSAPSSSYGGKPRNFATASRRGRKGSKAAKDKLDRTAGGFYIQQQPLGPPPVAQYAERSYQFHLNSAGFSQSNLKSAYSAKFVTFEQHPAMFNPQQPPRSAFSLSLDSGRDSKMTIASTNELLYTSVSSSSLVQPEFSRNEKQSTSRPLDPCLLSYGITTQPQMRDNFAVMETYSVPPPLVTAGDPLDHDDLEALRLSLETPQSGQDTKTSWDSSTLGNTYNSQAACQAKEMPENTSRPAEPKMSLLQKLLSE